METRFTNSGKKWMRKMSKKMFIGILLTLLLSSCHKGFDGRPGDAYLSLAWEVNKPYYIDAGPEIPPTFQWGDFYYANSGFYSLYYEGEVWTGTRWAIYAWEVDYEIWRYSGEPGGYGYHGIDGPDSYLTMVCSPYGPYEERLTSRRSTLDEEPDEITIEKEHNDIHLKITYRKVEPRGTKE